MGLEEIVMEIINTENWMTTTELICKNLWKVDERGCYKEFIILNIYFRKQERFLINELRMQCKNLDNTNQCKTKRKSNKGQNYGNSK